jgi:hypothetical protein
VRNTLLIFLALLIIFHRPLLIALIHAVAIKVAATQNIQLSLEVQGTIFTNLSLKNIRAVPNGKGATPVENISIEEVTVRYSIPSLVRKGVSEFLDSYVLRNAYIVVKPVEGTAEQKTDLASTLHGLIQQPALFSNHVGIDNLNLVAHVPDGEFAVKNLTLLLDPIEPGELDIGLLEVPKVRTWQNLKATATYANRDMILRGLEIDPQIVIQKFELDASRRAEGINRLDIQGALFGGSADFSLLVRQLPGKHKNNASNAQADINSSVQDVSLEKVSQYFHASIPAIGSVREAGVNLTGDPNTPSSWTGTITTEVGAVHAGSAVLDKATLRLDVTKGWATLGTTVFSGSNSVTVQADGKLPESLDGFAGTALTGWLNISGNDLHHLAGGVTSGSVAGDGTFDLRDNTLRAGFEVKASNVYTNAAGNDVFLSDAEVKAQVTKRLPPANQSGAGSGAAPFDGLETQLDAHVSAIQAGACAIDSADLGVSTRDAIVRLVNIDVRRAGNALSASGAYTMPRDMKSWATAPAKLDFSLNAPSIAAFNAEPNLNGLNGNLQAGGTLVNGPEGYGGNITANLSGLTMQDFTAQGLKLNISIAKSVATIDTLTFALNPTDGLSATGHVALTQPYAYDAAVQARIHDLSKFNGLVSSLNAKGTGGGPGGDANGGSPALQPPRLPSSSSPGIGGPGALAGALALDWRGKGDLSTLRSTGELDFTLKNGKFQTIQAINIAIDGSYSPEQLQFPTFNITSSLGNFSSVIAAQNNLLRVDQIAVRQANRPLLSGSLAIPLDLRTPAKPETLIPSNGPIAADLVSTDVALESFFPKGQAPATGTAKISIAARGSIDQPDVRVTVAARGLKAKAAAPLPPLSLDAAITLLGRQLSLTTRIAPGSGGAPLLSGSAAMPVDLRTPAKPETLVPSNGPISANLATGDLALESFFPQGKAPATGTGKVTITASGSLDQPNARVTVTGRNLKSKAAASVPPATFDAAFALLGQELSLKARLAEPAFSTVDIAGTIPLPLKQILHQGGRLDPQSPVQLSVRVPRGPLTVLTRIVPAIRFIQGTAEASVDVAGTVSKPQLSGAAILDLAAVRLANPDMPSISGFRGELRFAGDRLTLGQFGGDLSGGRFDLTGGILFADLTNPVIDLHFVSHGDLILRNEAVTVRADSDVRVSGPLAAASVTGNIGITKSRFFKQIDILPLELPGRPAPPPPPAPAASPSIDVPPLSNWKFALKIHTEDPFIIQGNLANGAALVDLNLGGTGKAPTLEGTVRIENFVASLPFSKLRITNGFVYFTKDDPFIPHLNIQATSNLQDYEVNVYIYGTAQDPKTVMSSEPPLRQQDIVSLLATGATTASLNSGTGLAGRAAVLLLQGIYHKIFKAKPPAENESFASRFKVNVGGVDARTGQQDISSSFKLSPDLYLIGDIDVGGDLRATVRYLLRFK